MATGNPFCFQRAEVKISCKFATYPDILVSKGKNLVANTTVLVAISSPADPVLTNGLKCEGGKGWELESMKIHGIQVHKKDQLKARRQVTSLFNHPGCRVFCYIKMYKVRTIFLSSNAYPNINTHPANSAA